MDTGGIQEFRSPGSHQNGMKTGIYLLLSSYFLLPLLAYYRLRKHKLFRTFKPARARLVLPFPSSLHQTPRLDSVGTLPIPESHIAYPCNVDTGLTGSTGDGRDRTSPKYPHTPRYCTFCGLP